ncbi:MAG: hypothetical protein AAF211_26835, partial [Myxococcota bacterium]
MIAWWLAGIAQAACTVISGATVHTPAGPEKGMTVVVADDRVSAVGRGLRDVKLEMNAEQRVTGARYRDESCRFVRAGGKHLSAGFVAA